jgi:hypothetical protein
MHCGIVNEDVNSPNRFLHGLDQVLDFGLFGDVATNVIRSSPLRSYRRHRGFTGDSVTPAPNDARTFARECFSHSAANAP